MASRTPRPQRPANRAFLGEMRIWVQTLSTRVLGLRLEDVNFASSVDCMENQDTSFDFDNSDFYAASGDPVKPLKAHRTPTKRPATF